MSDEKVLITPEQAKSCLLKGSKIHTFRSSPMALIGCDWSRKEIIKAFKDNADRIEIGGPSCRGMGHGLVVWTSNSDPLFIEADEEKLSSLEKEILEAKTILQK